MYRFSRAIYRELEDEILEDHPLQSGPTNHERVLQRLRGRGPPAGHRLALLRQADEDAVQRHPDLLPDVRAAARLQRRRPLPDLRREWLASQPASGYDLDGNRLECRATTRRGTACQRVPLPHNGYCPSHQHLAETEEVALAA